MTQRRSPFGMLGQPEAEYLSLVGIGAPYRNVLVTIRLRVDGRDSICHDTVPTLAWWSGMSVREVRRGIAVLIRHGLIQRSSRGVTGGPRGQTWSWTTRPTQYEDWPVEPIARPVAALAAYIKVFYPFDEGRRGAASSAVLEAMRLPKPHDEAAKPRYQAAKRRGIIQIVLQSLLQRRRTFRLLR